MKQNVLSDKIVLALLAALGAFSMCLAQSTDQVNAYKIAYEMAYGTPGDDDLDEETAALMELVAALSGTDDGQPVISAWVTPTKIRVEQRGLGGFVQVSDVPSETAFLLDTASLVATRVPLASPNIYTDYVGDSLVVVTSADAEVVFTDEVRTVAGYPCKQALLQISAEGTTQQIVVWYTEALPPLYWGEYDYLERIPGLALKIGTDATGAEIGIEASSVEQVMVDAAWFEVPDDYTLDDAFEEASYDAGYEETYETPDYELEDGRTWIDNGERWAVLDSLGEMVIPYTYEEVYGFTLGFAPMEKDGLFGMINRRGEEVFPATYENLIVAAADRVWVATNGLFGLVDTTGKELLKPTFDNAWPFSEELATVTKDGKYGFVDTNGKLVIPTRYEDAGMFVDGVAEVMLDGKVFHIGYDGKKIR